MHGENKKILFFILKRRGTLLQIDEAEMKKNKLWKL
jgi:hypothetical protein